MTKNILFPRSKQSEHFSPDIAQHRLHRCIFVASHRAHTVPLSQKEPQKNPKKNWEVGAMWAKTRSHERDHSSAVLLPAPETAPFVCNETRSLGRAIFMSTFLERDTPKHDCLTLRAAFLEHLCTRFNTAMLLVSGNLNTLMNPHIHLQNSSQKIKLLVYRICQV